jgi:hypothetical protein
VANKILKFFGPTISATLVFLLFAKSFPSLGECGMSLIAIVPFLFICSLLFGWLLLKVTRYLRGLVITTTLIASFPFFFYPVTCDDSPFSTIRKMTKILSNKSAITYSDQLQYADREKKVASLKKFKSELSPDKVYEIEIRKSDSNISVLKTIFYLKDSQSFCIDTSLFRRGSNNELFTILYGDTINIYFQDTYIDTKRMGIAKTAFVVNSDHEGYSLKLADNLELRITFNSDDWYKAYFNLNYWAYRLFYWLY